jgi:hypothetical protein
MQYGGSRVKQLADWSISMEGDYFNYFYIPLLINSFRYAALA